MLNKRQINYKLKNQKIEMPTGKNKKTERFFTICISIIIVVSQLGCYKPEPKVCIDYFNKPSTPRLREFSEYDLEKQLTIHRCGLDWHPPYDHSYKIAERGKNIIPTLLQKLNNDNYKSIRGLEKTKYGIILIFQRLAEDGDLNNNKEIVSILEKTVSEIRTDWIREESEKSLAEIKKNAGI